MHRDPERAIGPKLASPADDELLACGIEISIPER
jgi:hypothetical protein